MGISQTTSYRESSGELVCHRCNAPLLPLATFCGSCGERLDKKQALSSLLQDEQDIATRYRITSLVQRRPYVNLYFALDRQRPDQQRMVAIRDIDITPLVDEARAYAIELVQQEYDLLHRLQLPGVTQVLDLRYFRGHLFVVAGYPFASSGSPGESALDTRRLYTLQDFLQSGQGLPSEQRAVKWVRDLCQALEELHRYQIVVSDLDPSMIILNENSDKAQPALMISWLLPQLRDLLPLSEASMTPMSYFVAPEVLQGNAEARSGIYSLGAILYLLLTGSPPGESKLLFRMRLRAPRELNSSISPHVKNCVLQALSTEPSERFQSAGAMAEALYNPRYRRPRKVKQGPIPHRPLVPRPMPEPEQLQALEAEWKQQSAVSFSSLSAPQSAGLPTDANEEDRLAVHAEQVDEQKPQPDEQIQSEIASWYRHLLRLVLGQQQRITAAALVESPLRVQPDQVFTLRLHVMGRDEPALPPRAKEGDRPAGLSSLVHGDTALIEVRSVLYQSYAYIVQNATITIPAAGYVAEVTIPVQQFSGVPDGRRDRFHIFFMDAQNRPLYEKPFVLEVFVSHLVKPGQEGHHVLTIPV